MTEGKNTEHIRKAIEVLDKKLLNQINIITEAESKSGGQQLKNAFDALSKAEHDRKFLFGWDCDCAEMVNDLKETEHFKKFCFSANNSNTKARDNNGKAVGIENLYPDYMFTDDVYNNKEQRKTFDGSVSIKEFDKNKFLEKIKKETDAKIFANFQPLIDKIKKILED